MPSATERLEQLEQAVRVAARREQEVATDQRRAVRVAQVTEGALGDYYSGLGAGEPENPEAEERLRAELRTARERAEDEPWRARLEGAEHARQAAEQVRDDFGRERFAEIAAEQALLDPPVAEELQRAWEALQAAEHAYAQRIRVWTRLAPYGALDVQKHVPRLPTSGDPDTVRGRFARGVEVPTPRPLRRAPDATEEAA